MHILDFNVDYLAEDSFFNLEEDEDNINSQIHRTSDLLILRESIAKSL